MNKRTGHLIAGALFAFLVCGGTPGSAEFAFAQQEGQSFAARLNQIENQIQTLSRAVYRGEKTPPPSFDSAPSGAALGAYQERISAIEQSLQSLTNQVEQQGYETAQIKDRLQRALSDMELRLNALEQRGGPAPAADTTPTLQDDAVATPAGGASGTLGTLGASGKAGAADALYEEAFALIRSAKYPQAEQKFAQFIKQYPNHALTPNAQYWQAETYYVRGDYQQAAKLFATGYQNYPKAPKAADSLLKLSLSLAKLNRKDDACLALDQLKKEFAGDTSPVMRRAVQESKTLGCG